MCASHSAAIVASGGRLHWVLRDTLTAAFTAVTLRHINQAEATVQKTRRILRLTPGEAWRRGLVDSADTVIGWIQNFCSAFGSCAFIDDRKRNTVDGPAPALIVSVLELSYSCDVPCLCLLSGTDDGSTLTFHPVPGSVSALNDYKHITNLLPRPSFCHFSITAAVFRAFFHQETCFISGYFQIYLKTNKTWQCSFLSTQHSLHFQKWDIIFSLCTISIVMLLQAEFN